MNNSEKGLREYLKFYKNCLKYCSIEKSNLDDKKAECLFDIRNDYNDDSLCKILEIECPIVKTEKFRKLLLLFKEILKFIYSSRRHNGNIYDPFLITMIGSIPLTIFGIDIDELSCVKFPGDDSMIPQYPKSLSEYIIVFNNLMNVRDSEGVNLEGWVYSFRESRKDMNNFIMDFQPWSRMLFTFLVENGIDIPPIEKINKYGPFIDDIDDEYSVLMRQLQSEGLMKQEGVILSNERLKMGHKRIIQHLIMKLPKDGGKKTRKRRSSKTYKLKKKSYKF